MTLKEFIEKYDISYDITELNISHDYNEILTDLDGIEKFTKLKELNLTDCKFKSLPKLPDSLRYLNIWDNKLKELKNLPEKLKILIVNFNLIETIELPPNLKILEAEGNQIKTIKLPKTLKSINISYNPLQEITEFPEEIELTHIGFVDKMFDDTPIGEKYNNDWKTIQFVINNLNSNSTLRGKAAAIDSGLFDFKIN